MKARLVPRFEYHFSFWYLIEGIYSILFRLKPSLIEIQKYFEGSSIYFLNGGRSGLTIALKFLAGGKSRFKVGVQAFTCDSVFRSIKAAGAIPVFIDINDRYSIDLVDLKNKSGQLDCLIVTHTFGYPVNLDLIRKSMLNPVPIIEDCAHSLFTTHNGIQIGQQGIASIFSMGYGKLPALGNIGLLLINNSELNKKVQPYFSEIPEPSKIRSLFLLVKNYFISLANKQPIYGLISKPFGKRFDRKYDFLNKSEDNILRASDGLLYIVSKHFWEFKKKSDKRAHLSKIFANKLDLNCKIIKELESERCNGFINAIQVSDRKDFIAYMLMKGYECSGHFVNSVNWAKKYGYIDSECPNTEKYINSIVTVPIHSFMTAKRVSKLADEINSYNEFKVSCTT